MSARTILGRFDLRTPRVITALVLREMTTTYGRSAGGYLWAILEPVGGIVMLTVMFGVVMRSPPLGTSFPLFYSTGVVIFLMYNSTATKVAKSIQFSRPLLVYPRVTFLDAVIARFLLNALTQLVVAYIILTYLVLTVDTRPVLDFGAIALAIFMALSLGLGVGSLNCLLFAVFPTWSRIWAVLNRPLFLISGLFFIFEDMPPAATKILWFNPLIHVTGQMRTGFYPAYDPYYISVIYVGVLSLVPGVLGVFFLRRYHKKILNEL